jgi:hypothetical protein
MTNQGHTLRAREIGILAKNLNREFHLVQNALAGWLCTRPKLQVAQIITSAITVPVVDGLALQKSAPERLLHCVSVLENRSLPTRHADEPISVLGGVPRAARCTNALRATHRAAVPPTLVVHAAESVRIRKLDAPRHLARDSARLAADQLGTARRSSRAQSLVVDRAVPFGARGHIASHDLACAHLALVDEAWRPHCTTRLESSVVHCAHSVSVGPVSAPFDRAASARIAKTHSRRAGREGYPASRAILGVVGLSHSIVYSNLAAQSYNNTPENLIPMDITDNRRRKP